ncbi:nucleotidyltransferase family protein [Peribacillus simplex]|uniref:Nucleotidyltransferase family protein n=2 Tax=Peribacillus TaxID=2675229 RepID=A0AA90NYU0_9BACI|nr:MULTISPECIES: nucleotidyltransferase family protein [Peribacillus]MDP1417458.1 nucleotidyltransferase family protein [Peribacillus simplex]MDP1450113.1 nucleotidyltransferase family protein [Peribacillus frigoritolerans]
MDNNYSLDLSSLSNELRLLLEILNTEDYYSIGSVKNESYLDIDWGIFLQLAWHHRVYPLIYSKLKKADNNRIPPHVIQTLYKEFKKNTLQMLHLSGEMEKVSELFTENQIRLLYLKGPVIAADIYGDISLRTSKDLDILIPISDLKRAEELLLSIGYEKEVVPNVLNEWKWRSHHVVYFHPQKNIQLEIHWRLQPLPLKEPKFNELWERKRVSTLTSYPVYLLGKEDLLLYLISHGARHGWFRLRWLLDIDQMLRKGLKLDDINLLISKYQNRKLVGQALILTSELLKTHMNESWEKLKEGNDSKKIAKKAIDFIKGTESLATITSSNYYKDYSKSLKTILQKFFLFLILFYPSSADLMTLRVPKPLHFLYFPLRPFLVVWRKTGKPS